MTLWLLSQSFRKHEFEEVAGKVAYQRLDSRYSARVADWIVPNWWGNFCFMYYFTITVITSFWLWKILFHFSGNRLQKNSQWTARIHRQAFAG